MLPALLAFVVVRSTGPGAPILPGDAQRGKELFRSQNCVVCHSVDGVGGGRAPDLAKRIGRGFSPSAMAALMWNHAPAMWTAMETEGIARPPLTEQQAADLFTFFYSARYFDKPGDAARGKQAFQARRCAECHGLTSPVNALARPVNGWELLLDPIALAEQMWNHAAQMKPAMAQRQIQWPQLSSQELTDLMVYLQNVARLGGWRNRLDAGDGPAESALASAQKGARLFTEKGCQECHRGGRSHVGRYTGRSLTDFAAAMWNHAPWMAEELPALNHGEMRDLVGYLWTLQVFDRPGNPARGRQVFAAKHCADCHSQNSSGAPDLTSWKGRTHAFAMVEILWQHGPRMLKMMEQKGISWPRFETAQICDLIEYLNGTPR